MTTSAAKIAANRANAQRSTGPRTPEGKRRSSENSCTHGLSATRHVLLPDEDPEVFAELAAGYVDALQPDGPFEASLVNELISLDWRKARVPRIERVAVLTKMADVQRLDALDRLEPLYQPRDADADPVGTALVALMADGFLTTKLPRHEAHLASRRERVLALLITVQERRRAGTPRPETPTLEDATGLVLLPASAGPTASGEPQGDGTGELEDEWPEDLPVPVPSEEA